MRERKRESYLEMHPNSSETSVDIAFPACFSHVNSLGMTRPARPSGLTGRGAGQSHPPKELTQLACQQQPHIFDLQDPHQTTSFHSSTLSWLFVAHIFIRFSGCKPETIPSANGERSFYGPFENLPTSRGEEKTESQFVPKQ